MNIERSFALDSHTEAIAAVVVDAIFAVHKSLGPGLLESVYEKCLAIELEQRGLSVRRQVVVPIIYGGQEIEPGLRIDLLVDNSIIIEVKAVEAMHPIFQAQLLTYLKITELRLGFLVNFNVVLIKDGIRRLIR